MKREDKDICTAAIVMIAIIGLAILNITDGKILEATTWNTQQILNRVFSESDNALTFTVTGSLPMSGDLTIGGNALFEGTVGIVDPPPADDELYVRGDVGISEDVTIGGTLVMSQDLTLGNTTSGTVVLHFGTGDGGDYMKFNAESNVFEFYGNHALLGTVP